MPALLPCTLGHEGAGIVTEVGADVTTVRPGDHVVLTWNVPCRTCPDCLRGDSQLCPRGLEHAFGEPYAESADGAVWPSMGAGTLAEETLVPAAAVVAVDPSLPLDLAALLGCAVTTGVGAVMRTAAVHPGESVLVIGCGGVGLAAMQGARLAGAAPIIAADMVAASASGGDRQRRDRHGRRGRGRPRHRGPRAHRRRGGSRDRGRGQARDDPRGVRRHPPRWHGHAGGRGRHRGIGDVPGTVADGRRQDDPGQRLRRERSRRATSRCSPSWLSADGSTSRRW